MTTRQQEAIGFWFNNYSVDDDTLVIVAKEPLVGKTQRAHDIVIHKITSEEVVRFDSEDMLKERAELQHD